MINFKKISSAILHFVYYIKMLYSNIIRSYLISFFNLIHFKQILNVLLNVLFFNCNKHNFNKIIRVYVSFPKSFLSKIYINKKFFNMKRVRYRVKKYIPQ